jgi:hypothetical protein
VLIIRPVMRAELNADNQVLTRYLLTAHATCEKYDDLATATLTEVRIDQTQ